MLGYRMLRPGDTIEIGDRSFYAIDVTHTVPSLGFTVRDSSRDSR